MRKNYLITLALLLCVCTALSACSAPAQQEMEVIDVMPATPVPTATASAVVPLATPTPTATTTSLATPTDFELPKPANASKITEAKNINDDVIGWVKVPDTNIDYPILYGKDWYYNDHDINKKKSNSGTVYAYFDKENKNNTITAHNMRKAGDMFHELHHVQDDCKKLLERENRVWNITLFGHEFWEVFAIYETTPGTSKDVILFNTAPYTKEKDKLKQEWLDYQLAASQLELGVDVTINDTFLTMVTCGDTHEGSNKMARLYIFLKALD